MNYLHTLLFGLYPYLAGSVFLIGSLLRFDHGQYTWKTGSSQMLSSKRMRLASPLFHVGIFSDSVVTQTVETAAIELRWKRRWRGGGKRSNMIKRSFERRRR